MFEEGKKAMTELKVLREKKEEIDRLIDKHNRNDNAEDIVSLSLQKKLIESRIKELESSLYPDIIA